MKKRKTLFYKCILILRFAAIKRPGTTKLLKPWYLCAEEAVYCYTAENKSSIVLHDLTSSKTFHQVDLKHLDLMLLYAHWTCQE